MSCQLQRSPQDRGERKNKRKFLPFICNDYNENSNYCMARYILYSFIPVHVFQRSVEVLSWVVRFGASAAKKRHLFHIH